MGSREIWRAGWLLLAGLLLAACGTVPPPFSAEAYQTAVSLKYETLTLIDKSGESFAKHAAEVDALVKKYDDAYAAASRIDSNQTAVAAWQIIRDPNGASAGRLLQTWKQRSVLRPAFRAERKTQVTRHFDYVICIEAAKQGGPACTNPLGAAPPAADAGPNASSVPAAEPQR